MGAAERDLYRDTWVRYLGYANEVGESFRPLVPVSLVWASYGVATAYVTADAIDKGRRAATGHGDEPGLAGQGGAKPGLGGAGAILRSGMGLWGHWGQLWPAPPFSTVPQAPPDPLSHRRSVDFLMDSSLRKLYGAPGEPPAPH
ncbi:MTFP1 protein, partial [Hemiprocne comata]|nr:MTFP1 protein [Hemiprocne comata]